MAAAVVHALTSPRPKTRYLVGTDARAQAALRILPDRLRDRLVLRAMGLPLTLTSTTSPARRPTRSTLHRG